VEKQPAKLEEMPDFLTVEQVREVLPMIGKNKLYELIGDGTIPSKKLGRRVVVPKAGLQKMIQQTIC
jgi:excisionase family DNA binding protein